MRNIMKDMIRRQDSQSMFDFNRFDGFFNELYRAMDTFWSDKDLTMSAFQTLQPKSNFPKINVSETDDAYEVEIAISGFDKDDVELEFKDSSLLIKADKVEEHTEDKKWLTREIAHRSFRRVVQFPYKIKTSEIKSKYNETKGLVVCTLPKKNQEDPEVIKINID